MKKLIALVLLTSVSTLAIAGDHQPMRPGPEGMDHQHMGPGPGGMGHRPEQLFEKLDTDKDGYISEGEHETALKAMLERRRAHFKEMDTDGDGRVSTEEGKAAHKAMKKKFRQMFHDRAEEREEGRDKD